jgi:hypothetical protein
MQNCGAPSLNEKPGYGFLPNIGLISANKTTPAFTQIVVCNYAGTSLFNDQFNLLGD